MEVINQGGRIIRTVVRKVEMTPLVAVEALGGRSSLAVTTMVLCTSPNSTILIPSSMCFKISKSYGFFSANFAWFSESVGQLIDRVAKC